ncbi:MAG: VacB/RNase II family 3'-5' exoribonuclease [Acidobacteriota bacterium]|nr:VacB/RNase II family 3'-5' exoribonuclease [Acidobacteriota bacterium]
MKSSQGANAEVRWRGRISVHVRGFGFVDLESEEAPTESAFVAPPDLNPFLEGDEVSVLLEATGEDRYQAVELALEERTRKEVVGVVLRGGGREPRLELDPRLGNDAWPVANAPRDLRPGDTVVATPHPRRQRLHFHRLVEGDEAGRARVLAVHEIRHQYPDEALAEARKTRLRKRGRRDLREVPTVTIDAAHSRDLDDALAVLPVQEDGAIRVLVSIADVDDGVPEGSELDREARHRATSVYLPDLVVPMLPPQLSEDALSLQPGVDRGALTVELRIDREGQVTATDISPSLIRSTTRLTYLDVAAFLDRGVTEGVPEEVQETVGWLHAAACRLSVTRKARGGVTIEPDEIRLDLDETGQPVGLDLHQPTSAHLLIERLMVATNEAVARWLEDRGLLALFRVQDPPDPELVDQLAEFAANFGFQTAFGGQLSSRALAAFEEQFRSSTVAPSIRSVLHWALGRARYQPETSPHFALGAPAYLHFTSPIRRYADLVVHRIVKAHLRGERDSHLQREELEEIAEHINETARRAQKAERDRLQMLVARYFADRVGEVHEGRIVVVRGFGLVVQLEELGVSGTVATEEMGKGPWELDAATHSLVSPSLSSPRRRHTVGEAVTVRIVATDETLGRLELALHRRRRRGGR